MTGKPTLTVCILARNEEDNIKRAIASALVHATEILVVDTGSTDNTVTVARSMGATVLQFPWIDDFSAARNFALNHASGDWVLMLDADEALGPHAQDLLGKLLADPSVDAYRIHLVNITENGPISRCPIVRLFRNKPSYRYRGAIHEQIVDSIISANGRIRECSLVIEHYGYNEAENIRKSRRQRNLRLLEREVRKHPDSAYLHYQLGNELSVQHEYGKAEWHLERAIHLSKNTLTAARAAQRLSQIRLERARPLGLWKLLCHGKQYSETQIDSHLLCTWVALSHGDHATATREFEAVQAASEDSFGQITRTPQMLSSTRASILWTAGHHTEALRVWQQAVSEYPDDESLAVGLVRHRVLADGLGAVVRTVREGCTSPAYLSAVVGALLRARELDMAAKLACITLRLHYISTYTMYGLAYAGQWLDLEDVSPSQKVMGALALSTAAVWFQRPDMLENAQAHLPESWRLAFESVFWGRTVPAEVAWAVDRLMVHWADVGCLELLRAGATSLAAAGGLGRAAWLLWRAGCRESAVAWAMQDPTHPDSLEVLGLTAFENRDYELAGQLLTNRIQLGPARVQVYSAAAVALHCTGKPDAATVIRELGRREHPWSLLLQ